MLKRFTLLLGILSILLSLTTQVVSADGMIMPDLASADINVRYHHVTVTIKDTHAITSVEQEFTNPHDYPVTGHYVFPIPPGAAVTDFRATFGGQARDVIRQNVGESNIFLFNLVAEWHDPSLLQYADWETLTFDLVLPAKSTRAMTLSYQEMLSPYGGLVHYHYVLSTERYSAMPLEQASITVNIDNSRGIGSVYSSSHDVAVAHLSDGTAQVTWESFNTNPDRDFHLYVTPAEEGFGGGFLTGNHQNTDHFLFMFSPEVMKQARSAIPKDIVLIIDRSGSMAGEKILQAQEALHFIVNQLNERDRFSIVSFDDVFSTVSDTLLPVNRENLAAAHSFVSGLYDRNGTNIEGALQTGLRIFQRSEKRAGASSMIIFLTDGLPTEGVTDPQQIVDFIGYANAPIEARLHVFGVGYDVNTHLLDQLAENNGGSVTYVQPGENLESVLSGFYQSIANPVLTDITIDFTGITVSDLYPQQLPDLFANSTLMVTGQYHTQGKHTATITVKGNADGESCVYTYQIDLSKQDNTSFVPGLWATRRIGHLLDIIRVEGERAALVEEVRELGLSYGLVTPYTTFVIAAQVEGAASAENMALYGNASELNRSSGQITIQARVQNQSYQQATQVALARGANVINNNGQNLVQTTNQAIDLNLLRKYKNMDQVITDEWITGNIHVDRHITFGSDAYFKLAADPVARSFMQSDNNVLFIHMGEVIQVKDREDAPDHSPETNDASQQVPGSSSIELDNRYVFRTRDIVKYRIASFFEKILRLFIE